MQSAMWIRITTGLNRSCSTIFMYLPVMTYYSTILWTQSILQTDMMHRTRPFVSFHCRRDDTLETRGFDRDAERIVTHTYIAKNKGELTTRI